MNTVLAALTAAPSDPLVDTAKVRLSQDPTFNPTPDSLVADLELQEATFSGYTAGGYAVSLSAAVRLGTQQVGKLCDVLPIAATASPFVPNTIYGYWVDDTVNMLWGEKFADGIIANFTTVGSYLHLNLAMPFSLLVGVAA